MPKEDGENLVWKDKTGTYKLGYSQHLMKKQVQWQKINFVGSIVLMILIAILIAIILYVLIKLDRVDFFSTILYR